MTSGCGNKPSSNDPISASNSSDAYPQNHGRECGYRGCAQVEFSYKITHIARIDKQSNFDETAEYLRLWSQDKTKFKWQVDIVPQAYDNIPQVRLVVDEDQLPAPITVQNNPSSKDVIFYVDMINDIDEHGQRIPTTQWLKRNSEGIIEVEVQDISYCLSKAQSNSNNSADCHNKDTHSYLFRPQTISIPYHLNHKDPRFNLAICQAGQVASIIEPSGIAGATIDFLGSLIAKSNCQKRRTFR
ncbi:MAG: hypothetical protein OXC44_02525 [Proteobacteria bacterium]|nr:hypothetical protein [Pseudomonadota bacterium]